MKRPQKRSPERRAELKARRHKHRKMIWLALAASNLIIVILTVHGFTEDCVAVIGTTILHDWIGTLL